MFFNRAPGMNNLTIDLGPEFTSTGPDFHDNNRGVALNTHLHDICKNPAITLGLLGLAFTHWGAQAEQVDINGLTPLQHLCRNPSVTSEILNLYFQQYPGAFTVRN